MAFGLFLSKFKIFRKPTKVKLENVCKLLEACSLIHNFIIDERLSVDPNYSIESNEIIETAESLLGFLPSEPTNDEFAFLPNAIKHIKPANLNFRKCNNSESRNEIVNKIVEYGFTVPDNILKRRKNEI